MIEVHHRLAIKMMDGLGEGVAHWSGKRGGALANGNLKERKKKVKAHNI
jgi:hypothetical protein